MAVLNRDDLKADNVANLPDNIAQEISPADLRGQLDSIIDSAVFPEDGAGGSTGITVDTGETYRIIMLSDGTVRAVPIDAEPPEPPASLSGVVHLTSVSLSWPAATGGVQYAILRNGVFYSFHEPYFGLTFRDVAVTVGQTYTYQVSTVDVYQQRSPPSASFVAFVDPALNLAPAEVGVTCWPNPIPTDGPALVRVLAMEMNAQDIAFALEVDVGTLTPTADPAIWRIEV